MSKKIYFTLDMTIPETLHAQYNGKHVKASLTLVPDNLQAALEGKVLLEEERLINGMKFLMSMFGIDFGSEHFEKEKWYKKLWRIIKN